MYIMIIHWIFTWAAEIFISLLIFVTVLFDNALPFANGQYPWTTIPNSLQTGIISTDCWNGLYSIYLKIVNIYFMRIQEYNITWLICGVIEQSSTNCSKCFPKKLETPIALQSPNNSFYKIT